MTFSWDPGTYRQFDDHRTRPFIDLLARVGADSARRVVDLGCGPGHLTGVLAARWPEADVVGIDSSAQMLADAPTSPRVRFEQGDVRQASLEGVDVAVCNAVLQWVPDHGPLLARWADELAPGGWLAVQVPGNLDAPSHALMREVAAGFPAAAAALRRSIAVLPPEGYAALLLDAGLVADVWETTYLHVLDGPDPVLRWVRGTGLRPALAALETEGAAAFEARYAEALRRAYPARADGRTVFAFRRLFAVGRRA